MKFSALIPTRNRLKYLAYAIETVRRQDYDDWEVIVSDNDSTEDIRGLVESMNDPRIRYYRTDQFVPVTRNWTNALEKATGDYVVMLGDDDGLMPNYFRRAAEVIAGFDSPDLLYTGAFLFGYPGATAQRPEGFLMTYSYAEFFGDAREPFVLDREVAHRQARNMVDFRVTYGFNMQFALIGRKLIDAMADKGPLFQTPFPDYYAMNAMFLRADRIVVVPDPIVIIGICPKSYGSFLNKNDESEGVKFLEATTEVPGYEHLAPVVLPGTNINTSWLYSAETLADHYGAEFGLKVNYQRYRLLQAIYVYYRYYVEGLIPKSEVARLNRQLRTGERIAYWGAFRALLAAANLATGTKLARSLTGRALRRKINREDLLGALMGRLGQFLYDPKARHSGRHYDDVVEVGANLEPGFGAP